MENYKTTIGEKIKLLIEPIVKTEGMELIDIEYKTGSKHFLRIFVDKTGGLTHSDCAKISSQAGELLDMEDLIAEEYMLEVSSPGLDRPLKNEADFKRNKGNLVSIYLDTPMEGTKMFAGRVIDTENQKIILKKNSNEIINIPVSNIVKGNLKIEF